MDRPQRAGHERRRQVQHAGDEVVGAHRRGTALGLEIGDEGLALRLVDREEDAVHREQQDDLPALTGPDKCEVDECIQAIAEQHDAAATDRVTHSADQRRGADTHRVEQGVQQDGVGQAEAHRMRFQQQESKAVVAQREHAGRQQEALELRAQGLPVGADTFARMRRARPVLHHRQHHDARHGRHEGQPEQRAVGAGRLAEPAQQGIGEQRAEHRPGLVQRLVHAERIAARGRVGQRRQPGVARRPAKALAQALDDPKRTQSGNA